MEYDETLELPKNLDKVDVSASTAISIGKALYNFYFFIN